MDEWTKRMFDEISGRAQMAELATSLRMTHQAFREEGFTDEQAFELTTMTFSATIAAALDEDD